MRLNRRLPLSLVLLLALPAFAIGQSIAPVNSISITGTSRWLNSAQSPRFVPITDDRSDYLRIDSISAKPGRSDVFLVPQYAEVGAEQSWRLVIERSAAGVVTGLRTEVVELGPNGCSKTDRHLFPEPNDRAVARARSDQQTVDRAVAMQNLALLFDASTITTSPRVFHFAFHRGDASADIRMKRFSRPIGDTVIDGHRFHQIRDSSWAVRRERRTDSFDDDEHWYVMVGPLRSTSRNVAGPVVGVRLIDALSGRVRSIADSARLRGRIALSVAGRIIATSATSFEGMQLVVRATDVEASQRYAAATRRRHTDTLSARSAIGKLTVGDTMGYIRASVPSLLIAGSYPFIHPIVASPTYALQHGIDASRYFGTAIEALLRQPPALEADTMRWPCRPSMCQLLAAEYPNARDPDMRDFGLIVRFVMDPAKWGDTVIGRYRAGHALLTDAASMALGYGGIGDDGAGKGVPLPKVGAPWHEWMLWIQGELTEPKQGVNDSLVPLTEYHANVLRVAGLVMGRSFANEFARKFAIETSDTGRFVFGRLLNALHVDYRTNDEAVHSFATGTQFDRELAISEFAARFGKPLLADSATAAEIARAAVQMVRGRPLPWPMMPGSPPSRRLPLVPDTVSMGVPHYLVGDSVPVSVRDELLRVGFVTRPSDWRLPDSTAGVLIRLSGVTQLGPVWQMNGERTTTDRDRDGRWQGSTSWFGLTLTRGLGGWEVYSEAKRGGVTRICTM